LTIQVSAMAKNKHNIDFPIPVIDIFAGPGGLGEGFSAFEHPETKKKVFKIALSIEMEYFAHQTLTLRSFFRQFEEEPVPEDYYDFVRGKITLEDLYERHPEQAEMAKREAWKARLGTGTDAVSNDLVDERIKEALYGKKDFLLIGGPPCQAYSLVGRSRRKQIVLNEEDDEKVGLYKQYLRILAVHNPAVFIMENVKGMLSAKTEENPVFEKILSDLIDPVSAHNTLFGINGKQLNCPGYRIYSLVSKPRNDKFDFDNKLNFKHSDFIIKAENFGIPQARHRVILLGIRKDISVVPGILESQDTVSIAQVLNDLPKVRSGLSKIRDDANVWKAEIKKILTNGSLKGIDQDVFNEIRKQVESIDLPEVETGSNFISWQSNFKPYRDDWFLDKKLEGVSNHQSRGHMESDLHRYFFASCFTKIKGRSPKLEDFPETLWPAHQNIKQGVEDKKFADRFRVQPWDEPCKTITSHISKDGHYYIHPDPTQCRSFTVREAARIQTFPDNYFFYGPRTSQFVQVGNAVPPLLANQIAGIVFSIFERIIRYNINLKIESPTYIDY
jgi:DNA (cytosine-5)-methyltransferase 1